MGEGKPYGGDWNPALNAILSGWQMGGILNLRSGFPLTIRGTDRSGTISRGARADRVGNGEGPREVGPGKKWLDVAAFRSTRSGTLGNSGAGVVRGPGLTRFDLSLQKVFAVTESRQFEFRAEFYNLTNTPTFGAPNSNVDSPTFGEITGAQGERTIQLALKFYF